MAVLPSADNATEVPCSACPTTSLPTSFGPCCVNCASANCDERSRATKIRIDAQDDLDDLTCEIGQPRGIIEAPLDRDVGRPDSACVDGSPYTTTSVPSCLCVPKSCVKRPTAAADGVTVIQATGDLACWIYRGGPVEPWDPPKGAIRILKTVRILRRIAKIWKRVGPTALSRVWPGDHSVIVSRHPGPQGPITFEAD
jgi:hypothetical protein